MNRSFGFKIILVFLVLVIICFADLLLGKILNQRTVNHFRIKHHYYHHGLMGSQHGVGSWAGRLYPVYTNDYGFRDLSKSDLIIY